MRSAAAPSSCDFQAAHPESPLPACLYELAVLCPAFDAIGRYAHAQCQSLRRVLVALHGAAKGRRDKGRDNGSVDPCKIMRLAATILTFTINRTRRGKTGENYFKVLSPNQLEQAEGTGPAQPVFRNMGTSIGLRRKPRTAKGFGTFG